MFSFFSNKLTQMSNHYIDWSRIGSLINSNHRYSSEEIITRLKIISATGVSAFLGYQYSSLTENENYLTLTIAAGTLGFFLSHTYEIAPLIYKRYRINQECRQIIDEMKTLDDKMKQTINNIMQLSSSDEKYANASLTWGHRRTLLKNLKEELENPNTHNNAPKCNSSAPK